MFDGKTTNIRQVPVKPLQFHFHSTSEHVVDGELWGRRGLLGRAWGAPATLRLPPSPPATLAAGHTHPAQHATPLSRPPYLAGNVGALEMHIVTAVDNTTGAWVPERCNTVSVGGRQGRQGRRWAERRRQTGRHHTWARAVVEPQHRCSLALPAPTPDPAGAVPGRVWRGD